MSAADAEHREAAFTARALVSIATVTTVYLVSMITVIWEVADLPHGVIPPTVIYLLVLTTYATVTIVIASHVGPSSPTIQPVRQTLSRLLTLPLTYLVYLALGADLVAGILAGLLWIAPLFCPNAGRYALTIRDFLTENIDHHD